MGLALGEAAARLRRRGDDTTRVRLWTAGAIASNLPDLDFLYAPVTAGKLGYLLHHRGHTHTLVASLPLALVCLFVLRALFKARGREWGWLAAVSVAGPLLHVLADSWNFYGVHPFWPFDNRWYYGDSLFIIEPWVWVSLVPPLLWSASTRAAKAALGVCMGLGLGGALFSGYVPWQLAVLLSGWAAWMAGLMFKIGGGWRVAWGWGSTACVLLLFIGVSSHVRGRIEEAVAAQFPGTRLHDAALTPLPANPLCWTVHTVETQAGRYVSRRGVFAVAPTMLGAAECPQLRTGPGTFTTGPVPAPVRPDLVWEGQFEGKMSELARIRRSFCGADALLRFARVPAWRSNSDGTAVVGDLRFDRRAEMDFSEVLFTGSSLCPKRVPPWLPPRTDVLSSGS